VVGQSLAGYEGIVQGVARKVSATAEEKLESEFKKQLGPMGVGVFEEMKKKGMSKKSLEDYANSLVSDGIMKKEAGEEFKARLFRILEGRTEVEEIDEAQISRFFKKK
jgi:hypothetical protein